jgi:O-succinylbenzoate synthase
VRTAHGLWPGREGLLIRVEGSGGSAGYGEAAPVPGFGAESVDADEAAARALGEFLEVEEVAGALSDRLPCLVNALREASRGARGALEANPSPTSSAATNAGPASSSAAEANPTSTGAAPASPRHASLGVAALLPAGRAALTVAAGRVELGFRTFKWKVGVGDVADELGLLDDLCALLPETARLRLDANGSWEPRQGERWLARCAERPIEFVEQPMARDARGAQDRLLGLAQDYPVPIALDESIASLGDIEAWLGAGWPGVWVIKPSLLADPAAALTRLAAARADVVFSSALETGVGARTALRQAFDWRGAGPAGVPRALGFGVWPLFADGRFDGPPAVPVLRWSDVERIDPEAVWNAAN